MGTRLKRWYQKENNNAPGNFLQKVGIWVSIIFTVATGTLAVIAFNATTEIKDMQKVLATFKPSVRAMPLNMYVNNDSILIRGYSKNFGTRTAINIRGVRFIVTPAGTHFSYLDSVSEVIPNQPYGWDWVLVRDNVVLDHHLLKAILVTKIVFEDPITNEMDSAYTFRTSDSYDINNLKLYLSTPKQEEYAKKEIKVRFPSIIF